MWSVKRSRKENCSRRDRFCYRSISRYRTEVQTNQTSVRLSVPCQVIGHLGGQIPRYLYFSSAHLMRRSPASITGLVGFPVSVDWKFPQEEVFFIGANLCAS